MFAVRLAHHERKQAQRERIVLGEIDLFNNKHNKEMTYARYHSVEE